MVIAVDLSAIDGPGNILGSAGPTSISNIGGFFIATTGQMTFDDADVANLEAGGTFGEADHIYPPRYFGLIEWVVQSF